MADTVKVGLRARPKSDGTYPVIIRVRIGRGDQKMVNLGYSVEKSQFKKGERNWIVKHPNRDIMNSKIEEKRLSLFKELNKANVNGEKITARELDRPAGERNNFYEMIQREVDDSKLEKYGTYVKNSNRLKNLKEAWGEKPIPAGAITKALAEKYKAVRLAKEMSVNTIKKDLLYFSQMLVKHAGAPSKNPLRITAEAMTYIPSEIERLTVEEIKAIEAYDYPAKLQVAKDMFLFAYYSQGVRFGDVAIMTRETMLKEHVVYQMGKNGKTQAIAKHPRLEKIMERYINGNTPYLFPVVKETVKGDEHRVKQVGRANATINRNLKQVAKLAGVNKSLATHISRHSFANHALQMGYDITVIKELLGHSSHVTTERYIGRLQRDVVNQKALSIYQ